MSDDPRKPRPFLIKSIARWMSNGRGFFAALSTALVRRTRRANALPICAVPAPSGLQQNFDAVIDRLAGPAVARLSQAAERLQPVMAADISALESAADLQLAELTRSLRLQYAALSDRAAADRAVWASVDLPQALRADVKATRGTASGSAA